MITWIYSKEVAVVRIENITIGVIRNSNNVEQKIVELVNEFLQSTCSLLTITKHYATLQNTHSVVLNNGQPDLVTCTVEIVKLK